LLKHTIKYIGYALTPLGILFSLITLACILGYLILMSMGDVWPLHRMISKLTQLFLVLSIFPLRRYLKLSWTDLGFAPKTVFFKQIATGVGFGVLTLLPILSVLYGLEVHVLDTSRTWTLGIFLKRAAISLFLAVLISIVEEPLFRGVLLSGFRQRMNLTAAILLGSGYYASLHFLESHTPVAYQDITFSSGFILFGEAIRAWLNPETFSGFIGLWAVGIFLAVVRTQIKQSLGLCIGFHASWVWQIKLSKDWFNVNPDSPYLYLVSRYDGLVGSLIAGWLLFAVFIFLTYRHFGIPKREEYKE
jgi:uncharacterized protein